MKEAELYPPVKAFLEARGYTVKAEIGAADVMALRGDDAPLIVELKTALNLALILQGVARQAMFDDVYLAVPQPPKWTHRYKDLTALLRRLGLGLLTVKADRVTVHLDPAPYQPRQNKVRAARMLREFRSRVGDPNIGGTTRQKRMTAYRQDALRLAAHLSAHPAASLGDQALGQDDAAIGADTGHSPRHLAAVTGVQRAGAILRDNHYGWFIRIARGTYGLTAAGRDAVAENPIIDAPQR